MLEQSRGRASGSRWDENRNAASVTRRASWVGALCLLAVLSALIARWTTPIVGLVLLGCALWLVARSPWPLSTRIALSVTAVVGTIALFVGVLLLVVTYSYD
jgi:hypothetical protein